MTIRVLIADDQPLVRAGFASLVDSEPNMTTVGQAIDGEDAIRMSRALLPDVVVMDIRMPVMDGITATTIMTSDEQLRALKVLVLTTFESDDHVMRALQAGASGFLGKGVDPDQFVEAIQVIADGEALLSPSATRALIERFAESHQEPEAEAINIPGFELLTEREREMMVFAARGLSNAKIAAAQRLSPHTVKTHINRAMTKTGAHDRAQLVVYAYQSGMMR